MGDVSPSCCARRRWIHPHVSLANLPRNAQGVAGPGLRQCDGDSRMDCGHRDDHRVGRFRLRAVRCCRRLGDQPGHRGDRFLGTFARPISRSASTPVHDLSGWGTRQGQPLSLGERISGRVHSPKWQRRSDDRRDPWTCSCGAVCDHWKTDHVAAQPAQRGRAGCTTSPERTTGGRTPSASTSGCHRCDRRDAHIQRDALVHCPGS